MTARPSVELPTSVVREITWTEPAVKGDTSGKVLKPAKISTDISLVAIDRSDPEAFALAEVILRGVTAGLERYLLERSLFRECCPEQESAWQLQDA